MERVCVFYVVSSKVVFSIILDFIGFVFSEKRGETLRLLPLQEDELLLVKAVLLLAKLLLLLAKAVQFMFVELLFFLA